MKIYVISAFGTGETTLSAFDNALLKAGVHNYNIITLSSIIPKGSDVIKTRHYKPKTDDEYGYKLYAVKSEIRSSETKRLIAAGVGWYQKDDGCGVFVEHNAVGVIKKDVENELISKITSSIKDLCEFRKIPFTQSRLYYSYAIGIIENKPACALTIAVYQTQEWG